MKTKLNQKEKLSHKASSVRIKQHIQSKED